MREPLSPVPTFSPRTPLRADAYPDDLGDLTAGMSDEQAIQKIGQRTTATGRVVAVLVIAGAAALVWFYMKRSEAYESRMDGVIAAGKLKGGEMLTALRGELGKTEYDDVKERVIMNLGHFKDKDAVPAITQELDRGGIVRRAAALALASIGSPAADAAKPKLLQVLPVTDEKDRPQVVWALAVLKESSAADVIIREFTTGMLQAQPGFDAKIIVDALGIPKLSTPELTGHPERSVRTLVATALSEAASPAVVAPLVRMIQNPKEDAEVVRACVQGLGRSGDPASAQPLFQLMQDRAEMRQSVIDALAKSTAAPQLAALLAQATNVETKRDLVRLVRRTYDPRSADALAALVGDADEDTKSEAAHGLADLGDARAVEPLLALARSPDEETGTDAIDALRRLRNPAAAPGLLTLVDEQPFRKAAIMRALGATGAASACPMLVKELSGDDIGAAAKAIGEVPCDKDYGTLAALLPRSKYKDVDFTKPSVPSEMAYRNRLEALMGLQYFGRIEGKLVDQLVEIIEDTEDDFRLQTAAGITLGKLADAETYALVLKKIADPNLPEATRANYVQGLWQRPNAEVSTQLMPLMQASTPPAIRRAAALAIGYAGNAANDEGLRAQLDDAAIRRDTVLAAVLGGNEAAAEKLLQVLPKDRDAEDILRMTVGSNESDDFNMLSAAMFESGQIYRRLRVADILKTGTEDVSYGYVWGQLMTRLRTGWDGPGGVTDRFIRDTLYKELTTGDPARRSLVADALASMNLRGLLLAARDAGVTEARQVLLELDRPRAPATR